MTKLERAGAREVIRNISGPIDAMKLHREYHQAYAIPDNERIDWHQFAIFLDIERQEGRLDNIGTGRDGFTQYILTH